MILSVFFYTENPWVKIKSWMLLKSCQQLIPSIFIYLAGVKNKSLRWRDWSLKLQHETLAWLFLLCPTEGDKIHLNHCNEGNLTAELSETKLSSLSWLTGPIKDGGEALYICTAVMTATYLYNRNNYLLLPVTVTALLGQQRETCKINEVQIYHLLIHFVATLFISFDSYFGFWM